LIELAKQAKYFVVDQDIVTFLYAVAFTIAFTPPAYLNNAHYAVHVALK
jgi:hypothetical protein